MNKPPLAGRRILVTRPAGQQEELRAAIETAGGEAIALPLLAIEAAGELEAKLEQLHDYSKVIFISVNAVRFAAERIAASGGAISPKAEIFAVGKATARAAAASLGRPAHSPANGGDSEKLLAMPQLKNVRGDKIAIFRGAGGRELLAAELCRRGANVDYLEVYRRVPEARATARLRQALAGGCPDFVILTSAAALNRWRELIDQLRASIKPSATAIPLRASVDNPGRIGITDQLMQTPLAVPSPRVAELAARLGFSAVLNAGGADAQAIVAALTAHRRRRT